MKLVFIASICVFVLLSTSNANGQGDYETVFNPKTGNVEQQYNPWNPENTAQERRADNQRFNDLINSHRQSQARASQAYLRQLSINLYQAAVLRTKKGETRIKNGQASTGFKNLPGFSLKNYLLSQVKTPDLKLKVEQFAEASFNQFTAEVRAHGLQINDIADGEALAFVIAYELYFGGKSTSAHLQWLRQKGKEGLLKDSWFQGGADEERQRQYEMYGALIMYAQMIRRKNNLASVSDLQEAKDIAAEVLRTVWGNSTDTILMTQTGFMHKGNKIIADGKATHLFAYNANLPTARRMASNSKTQGLAQVYQNNLNLYYQELARRGGQRNDLAWCGTLAAYANYVVLTDGKDLNPIQLKSVYSFVKNAILKSPNVQAASDENKQFACEIFAINAASNYQSFRRDFQQYGINYQKTQAQIYLKEFFQALGENPASYKLTDTGIIKVRNN